MKYNIDRKVGGESRRSYKDKIENGFFEKYMSGKGLEVGSTGYEQDIVPILETAIPYNLGDEGYDGLHLPVKDNTQDFIYSSHVVEHIEDYKSTIQEWYRVLKINGYMIIIVPHKFLYERQNNLPSIWNQDHKRYYSPSTLLNEIEESLEPNSYRIRYLEDNDKDYKYSITPPIHPEGCYEITLVLEKIKTPSWKIE